MLKWKDTELRDVCSEITYGYTASANAAPIGPKFLRITDIASGPINWDTVPYCEINKQDLEKYRLEIGDIVIARTGATTGYNAIIKKEVDAVFASYLIRYKVNQKIANPFFVGYILQSNKFQDYVDAIAGGSAQPGANAQQFADFEFSLPSIPEQIQIANILSGLDDKIDLLHRQNKTLEQLAETLFRQWFVGEAEESWDEVSLSGIAIHFKQTVTPAKTPTLIFKHYSLPAFDDGKEPKNEIGKDILSGKYQVVSNSILISKLNPRTPRIWGLYGTIDEENSICSTEFQVVKPKEDKYYSFIYCYLKSYQVLQELSGAASGTSGSHQRVNPQDIFNLSFPKPPEKLIEQFDAATKFSFEKIKSNTNQIRTLTQLRDALLPKLISGEIRIN